MKAPGVTKSLLAACSSALFLVLALGSVACEDEITGSNEALAQVEIEAPDTARAGIPFEVQIKASNVGQSNIRNARISAFLPTPLTILSVGPSAGTTATFSNGPAVGLITWDLGTLDSNSQSHLAVQVVAVLAAAEASRTVTIEVTLTGQSMGAGDTVARYNVTITSGLTGATPTSTRTRTPTLPGLTATPTPPGATATPTRTPTLPGPTATSTPPAPTLTPTLPGPTATSTPPAPTLTPTLPGPTATSTPPAPTPTRTPTPPAPTATRTPTPPAPTATSTPPAPTPTRTPTLPAPTATSTPPAPTATRTPTPPAPTPTRTPTPGTTIVNLAVKQFEWIFNGVGNSFQMRVGQTYEVRITNTDPAGEDEHGFSGIPALGMSGAVLFPGNTVTRTVMPTAGQVGIYPFSCSEDGCGSGHDGMLATIQVVP